MSRYKVKTGFNQALVDLVDVAPRCRSTGIQAIRRDFGADGSVEEQGAYVELILDVIQGATSYAALLTQFGLSSTVSEANVTVYVRNNVFAWVRKNGIAVRPEIGQDITWERNFPRNIKILVKDLTDPA